MPHLASRACLATPDLAILTLPCRAPPASPRLAISRRVMPNRAAPAPTRRDTTDHTKTDPACLALSYHALHRPALPSRARTRLPCQAEPRRILPCHLFNEPCRAQPAVPRCAIPSRTWIYRAQSRRASPRPACQDLPGPIAALTPSPPMPKRACPA
jgi:hypothetical protein